MYNSGGVHYKYIVNSYRLNKGNNLVEQTFIGLSRERCKMLLQSNQSSLATSNTRHTSRHLQPDTIFYINCSANNEY